MADNVLFSFSERFPTEPCVYSHRPVSAPSLLEIGEGEQLLAVVRQEALGAAAHHL